MTESKRTIDKVAIFISLFALIVSSFTFLWTFYWPGKLQIYPPNGWCIVRGYQNWAKSDFLVLPVVVENTGQGVKIVEQPTLRLMRNDEGGNAGQKIIIYEFIGFLTKLRSGKLDKEYEPAFDLTIPENSLKSYFMMFGINDWWNPKKIEPFNFQFKPNEEWIAQLAYWHNGSLVLWENSDSKTFFTLNVYDAVEELKAEGDYDFECYPFKGMIWDSLSM